MLAFTFFTIGYLKAEMLRFTNKVNILIKITTSSN